MCRLLTRPDRAAHHPAAPAEVRHVDHAEHIEGFMHDIAAGKTAGRGEDQATRSIGRAWRPWCRRAHCSHCRGAIFTYAVSKVFASTTRCAASSSTPLADGNDD